MTLDLLEYISSNINISIIVGGGITSYKQAHNFYKRGASFVVIGNALESNKYIP